MASPPAEPQPVAQPQPDAGPIDGQAPLTEPLRQLQPSALRDSDAVSSLVQSPPLNERRVNSMERLPSIPEETPDKRKQREKEEIERKRREQESLEFQQRFDLSPTEPLIEDYSCAHTTTGAIYQGRLYLSKSYMCFYSPLFSKLLRVNLRKLVEIEKRSTLGVFPNGIEVTTENGKKISFISFIYRDQAYNTLCRLVKELKELGTAPPPTPHGEELPNIHAPEDEKERGEPRTGARRTLSRSLSFQPPSTRSTSPVPGEERKNGSYIAESGLRNSTTASMAAAPEDPAAGAGVVPASTPAQGIAKTDSTQKDKESVPPAKRPEEPKGGKEAISPSNSGAVKTEKEAPPNSASTPPAAASALEEKTREASPPRAVVALPIAAPPPTVDPLSSVPITDKCTHLTAGKTAPVLTHTLALSLSTFFRRVIADGTNTWMLALRDPNADSFFTQSPWAASKEKCCLQRKLEFQVPFQSPIKSGVTRVVQEHTIRSLKADSLVFESSSQSLDVPYSDSFSVITRIDVESTGTDSCHLALRTEVKWLKSVWMLKGTIESKAIEGNTQFLTHWLDVVKRKATEIETPEPPRPEAVREQKVVDEKPLPQTTSLPAPGSNAVTPAAPLQLPSVLRQSGSFASSASQAQQAQAAGFALPFSLSTVLIGVGMLMLLLIFLFLRVSAMETQLVSLRGANERLERRLIFLQSFVSALSENVTGTAGALKDQLAHWQAFEAFRRQLAQGRELTRTAAALMDRMVQQQAEYELALSRAVAEQAYASADTTAVLFADAAESSASWGASLVALILTALLAMMADLYLLSGAITFRLLRRNKN